MTMRFRRIRGRAPGHVVTVNTLLVRTIDPTPWGGSEIAFSDVHVVTSRDDPDTVQQLLEGHTRLCRTPLCDRATVTPYTPVCARCRDAGAHKRAHEHQMDHVLVELNGRAV